MGMLQLHTERFCRRADVLGCQGRAEANGAAVVGSLFAFRGGGILQSQIAWAAAVGLPIFEQVCEEDADWVAINGFSYVC